MLGREALTLVDGEQQPGDKAVSLSVASWQPGLYFYRLQAGAGVETRTMLVVK